MDTFDFPINSPQSRDRSRVSIFALLGEKRRKEDMLQTIANYFITVLGPAAIAAFYSQARKTNILHNAVKSMIRAKLLVEYEEHIKRGFISPAELTEWQNQYEAYHKLVGKNGVLDDRYVKLLQLPAEKEE